MDIAVLGYGVVGSGVADVVSLNESKITDKLGGEKLNVKYILDLRKFPGDKNENKIVDDFNVILNDKDVKIVAEAMGGLHPAFEFVSSCLEAGKSVVTSNKELVAEKGDILLETAKKNNVNFMFEASVGGGIPVLRPIIQCLAGNEITEVAGILNGTTNFILSKMIFDSMSFEDALKLAQDNGYAEKDPTADIEGFDACRKICILAALCFGKHVYPKTVYTEGITKITLEDVDYARSWGGVIKLLGRAKKIGDKTSATVTPAFVADSSILSGVNGVFNSVLVRGNAVGDVAFYGQGAGKMATASAVVGDIIDCAQNIGRNKGISWDKAVDGSLVDIGEVETALYVRATGCKCCALKKAEELFGEINVLSRENAPEDEFAFVTPVDKENALREKLAEIEDINVLSTIRVVNY